VAGKGGEMAEIRLGVVEAEKAGSKRARRVAPGLEKKNKESVAGSGAGEAVKEQEVEKTEGPAVAAAEPEKKEPEKRERGNGLKRLQRAADRRLGRASEGLADLLLDKAKAGKVDSTRLLVSLAEGKKERKPQEKKKNKRSMGSRQVELLCSEPEWKQPELGDVWVGDGWRKQGTGEFVGDCEPVDEGEEEAGPGTEGRRDEGTKGAVTLDGD